MGRDLRKYAGQTNVRLVAGGILLLFIIGDGLIYLFLGRGAAVMGFTCLLLGLAPLVLIWLVLWLIEVVVRRVDGGEE